MSSSTRNAPTHSSRPTSIPAAGLLVSAYALGDVISAELTLTTGRVPRRAFLTRLAGIFTAGNLMFRRRFATRYDRLAANFLDSIHLAVAITWWL